MTSEKSSTQSKKIRAAACADNAGFFHRFVGVILMQFTGDFFRISYVFFGRMLSSGVANRLLDPPKIEIYNQAAKVQKPPNSC